MQSDKTCREERITEKHAESCHDPKYLDATCVTEPVTVTATLYRRFMELLGWNFNLDVYSASDISRASPQYLQASSKSFAGPHSSITPPLHATNYRAVEYPVHARTYVCSNLDSGVCSGLKQSHRSPGRRPGALVQCVHI